LSAGRLLALKTPGGPSVPSVLGSTEQTPIVIEVPKSLSGTEGDDVGPGFEMLSATGLAWKQRHRHGLLSDDRQRHRAAGNNHGGTQFGRTR
jgi:hypothetical protein